jgi:hypothetical protein
MALICILTPSSGTSGSVLVAFGQVSQEDVTRALDMLGEILGLPEIEPDELKKKVEEVGKLRFTRSVPIDFMSREELARYIHALFEEEYSPNVAAREERMLRAFGFLAPGEDLRVIRERVLNENIAGFYDERPGAKKLFAVSSGRKLNLMNQLILSHELRHALQDQHVDLDRILGDGSDYDDQKLAALSLLEGDATLLMELYLGSGSAEGDSPLGDTGAWGPFGLMGEGMEGRAMAEMFAGPELKGAPPVVREQLIVPYFEGRQLAMEIFKRGGFELLNAHLQEPPRSMEQVLHPEKYLDQKDEPIPVSLGRPGGANVESAGQLGEFLIRVLLEPGLPQQDTLRAAEGWGGDRYAVWSGSDGNYHLLWRTVWDSEQDAEEFFQGLSRAVSLRFGSSPQRPDSSISHVVSIQGKDGSQSSVQWSGREVVLEREGFR